MVNICHGLFSIWQTFVQTLAIFYETEQIFNCCKWPKIEKYSSHLVTLSQRRYRIRNRISRKTDFWKSVSDAIRSDPLFALGRVITIARMPTTSINQRDGIYRECILEHFLPISKETPKPSASTES